MIPLRDDNPTRTTPVIMYVIVVLNVILFFYNGPLRPDGSNRLAEFVLVPRQLTGGAGYGPGGISPWLTILTSMFLHANFMHLAGNMLFLWVFGNNIEDVLGHFRFLAFYLLAGLAAALLQVGINVNSTTGMVGASGAIAGVLGGYIVLYPRARVTTLVFLFIFVQFVALPASVVLGLWFVMQIINSALLSGSNVQGGVAYWAHIGGFVAGVAMVYIFGGKRLLSGRVPYDYERLRRYSD